MLTADLFYSFRSPYSYLSAARYRSLTEEYDLKINLRPVYPAAVRDPWFFERRNPLFSDYLTMDVARSAEYLGVPCKRPVPDPVQFVTPSKPAESQPYIHRLTWLGVLAVREGKGMDFACEIGWALWSEQIEGWDDPEKLAPWIARVGMDLAEMDRAIIGNESDLDAEVRANQKAEEDAGHWGTPCLVFEGEPFFGQDRIDMAIWRMKQRGLEARVSRA